MTENSFSPLRRALLGAMFASVALPRPSFAQQRNVPTRQEPTDMRIRLTFNGKSMTATLYDNPSARDLVSLLPLDLTIDNYGKNEKIAYLPRKLTEEGSGPFGNEAAGDLCYFAPWGNLALFYAGYRWSEGLIRLGRFQGSFEPLLVRGKFPLRIERIP
ncbi:cyclophilin-like fold protein [Microvirga brassicacearum]|uniref:MFS transporter n=1 Tax=Microvirga brassicacearum TaxID=2580413 RepID=A0A5N3PDU3_9HYPH|nr:cyclophilin-like fold protein [Microvirga brassicacearum]KAB0267873.1 MFS transporter [Microvirga brassicacearum]